MRTRTQYTHICPSLFFIFQMEDVNPHDTGKTSAALVYKIVNFGLKN